MIDAKSPARQIERVNYICWNQNARSRTAVAKAPVKSSRYFEVTTADHTNSQDVQIIENSNQETSEFQKRRSALLSRIFRSKTGDDDAAGAPKSLTTEQKELKFFDDFIPFSVTAPPPPPPKAEKVEDKPAEKYEPRQELNGYSGPYSEKCLLRARKNLIDSFRPVTRETVYTDRQFEILKIKLNIPSKFDNDKKLMNRLRNKKNESSMRLNEKLRLAGKLSKENKKKLNKHIFMKDEDSDDDASFVSDYSFDKNEVKTQEKEKFKSDKNVNVFFNLYEEKDEETVATAVESADDDVDIDSKCRQFDEYKNRGVKTRSSTQQTLQEEINALEEKYREIRDERNRVNKNVKKKQKKKNVEDPKVGISKTEANLKRDSLMDEMKKIRRHLKLLRKESRIAGRRNYKQRKRQKQS